MEIAESARKHGVADADILHAIALPIRQISQGDDRVLILGADRGGDSWRSSSSTPPPTTPPSITPCHYGGSSTASYDLHHHTAPEVNPMPRTRAQLEQAAAEAEAWLDNLDPNDTVVTVDDPKELRDIAYAIGAVASAERNLATIAAARHAGRSWNEIARILGISRQAAQKRYDAPAAVVPEQR